MSRSDDELERLIDEAHRPDRRSAPDFDRVWDTASQDALERRSRLPLVAAAAILVAGGVALGMLMAGGEDESPARDASTTMAMNDSAPLEPEAYAIVEWRAPTDALLPEEEVMEPLRFGEGSWSDGWGSPGNLDGRNEETDEKEL